MASLGAAVVSTDTDIDFLAIAEAGPAPVDPRSRNDKEAQTAPEFGSALRLLLTCTTCHGR